MQQPSFLNAVAQVITSLSARQLFSLLVIIEDRMGRQRLEHWGPRLIDLDLLLYGDSIVDEPDLKIPHPQMHLRSFVLNGVSELEPHCIHPVLRETVLELSRRLNGGDFFLDPSKPQLVCVAGNIGVGKTTLAQGLTQRLGGMFIAENYSDNPYLADVYAGHGELALDSELFFLSSGAAQLERQRLRAGGLYVSDYVFDKAMIYASSWLNSEQMREYKRYYDSVAEGVAMPVLVIYLNDSLDHCLQRIHNRNRPYEQRIEKLFLEHLGYGYEALYRNHTACPVMRMTSDRCFMPEQVDGIANQVRHYTVEVNP
jgi:deoxyadenosine/deoxycytidine kinase